MSKNACVSFRIEPSDRKRLDRVARSLGYRSLSTYLRDVAIAPTEGPTRALIAEASLTVRAAAQACRDHQATLGPLADRLDALLSE
ncbi:MAG: hypothetical protein ACYDA1_04905 [Vulcanimicrobiaceae bacterium]